MIAILRGDPGRLRQIVVNLAGNAIKFTERGEVFIDVSEQSRRGDQVEMLVCVQDTGIGVPGDKLDLIFDAFSQADSSTTREYGGTGLGLAICSQLIEMMGGRIWVESKEGEGTSFFFTIVLKVGRQHVRAGSGAAGLAGKSVLIVDDNATNRRVLEEILANWMMKTVSAADGARALEELRQGTREGPFEVVILDCMMPDMDGFAVAESIRRDPRLQDLLLVMISSANRPGDAERCRELGVARYMTKPVIQSDLLNALLVAADDSQPTDITNTATADATRSLNVLLVEDGLVNQRVALGLLRRQGHQVTVAANGQEAVNAFSRGAFDVILMDVQMPVMDGLEATAAIREMESASGRHIPIIAMTAGAMKGDRERCLDAGMDDYVTKPIDAGQLVETLSRIGDSGLSPED